MTIRKQARIRLGAHAVVESFKRNSVRKVFIYPGGTIAPILDVISKETDIEIVCPRNEQGAGYAALAYARLTGRPAVFMVTSGPGATNAVTPIADAYFDNVPVILLTGQVGTHELRGAIPVKQRGFQECDTTDIMRPVTKASFLVTDVRELPTVMERAFFISRTGRQGPVVVDLPMNVQRAPLPARMPSVPHEQYRRPPLPRKKIATLARLIVRAERPVILAGGGIIAAGATREMRALARRFSIPVVMSLPGIGAVPSDDPLSLGLCGYVGSRYANLALHRADLVVALGTTLHVRQTGSLAKEMTQGGKVARIDIDANELAHSRVPLDLSIHADTREALVALNVLLSRKARSRKKTKAWLDTIAGWKQIYTLTSEPQRGEFLKPQDVIRWVDRAIVGDAIVTTGVGQHQMWVPRHFSFSYPERQLLTSSGHGTMGFDLPAAIGAKIASPQSSVLCVVGDGSLQMNIQELATIAERKLDIKIIVLDNHSLNIVAQFQRQNWKSHPATGDKYNPDFAHIARAYGIPAVTILTVRGARQKIIKALKRKGPVLIHCTIDPQEDLLPMLLGGHKLDDMTSESSF